MASCLFPIPPAWARNPRKCPGRCFSTREQNSSVQGFIQSIADAKPDTVQIWDIFSVPCENLAYSNELWSSTDRSVLQNSVRSWRSRCTELCPLFEESIISYSQLAPETMDVKWRATWVPRQLLWLDSLGKAWPGVSVEYFDILDRYDQHNNLLSVWPCCSSAPRFVSPLSKELEWESRT